MKPDSKQPCPHCGGSEIFRSHRRNAVERYLLRAIGVRPFRCVNCDARFLSAQALRWLPNTGRQSDLTNSSSVFRKKSDHALRRFPERHPLRLLHVTVNEDRRLLPLNSDLLWLRCLAWLAGAEVRSLKVFFEQPVKEGRNRFLAFSATRGREGIISVGCPGPRRQKSLGLGGAGTDTPVDSFMAVKT